MLIPPDPMQNIDFLYDTDNDYGVPALKPYMQAPALYLPVEAWGSIPRSRFMPGTYVLYIYDDFINPLWRDPWKLRVSSCNAITEANFTITKDTPWAVALYQIYRKRWLSRFWADSLGCRIFVDLNVPPNFMDMALLGVPKAWGAFCTRGNTDMIDITEVQFRAAEDHTGLKFKDGGMVGMVYGGGKRLREFCKTNGLIYVEQYINKSNGKAGYLLDVESPDPSLLEEGRIKLKRRQTEGLGLLNLHQEGGN
jgi:hypothetical protein